MEKHKRTRIIISGIAVIIWMIVIFIFSAMTGEESGNLSSGLVHALLKNIPFLAESELAHFVVRKLAHMTEYAIFCLLIINLEKQIGFRIRLKHILIGIFIILVVTFHRGKQLIKEEKEAKEEKEMDKNREKENKDNIKKEENNINNEDETTKLKNE